MLKKTNWFGELNLNYYKGEYMCDKCEYCEMNELLYFYDNQTKKYYAFDESSISYCNEFDMFVVNGRCLY